MTQPQLNQPTAPWWIAETEHCGHCWSTYVWEQELRCVACDGPMCPSCAVTVTERLEVHCPACGTEASESDHTVASPGSAA